MLSETWTSLISSSGSDELVGDMDSLSSPRLGSDCVGPETWTQKWVQKSGSGGRGSSAFAAVSGPGVQASGARLVLCAASRSVRRCGAAAAGCGHIRDRGSPDR